MRQDVETRADSPHLQKNKAVLNEKAAAQHYQLERIYPGASIADIVEQFWWVCWDLGDRTHTQRNLPDPAVNLTVSPTEAMLTGPVSTHFSHSMTGQSWIFGIKFTPAGYSVFSMAHAKSLIDLRRPITHWLGFDLAAAFGQTDTAEFFVRAARKVEDKIAEQLVTESIAITSDIKLLNHMVLAVKEDPNITRVEQLASDVSLSVRQCQRLFSQYLGLPPKWVIRHYRIQEIIARLNGGEYSNKIDWAGLAADLGFSDQAHFIKEFKCFSGMRPSDYSSLTQAT